MIKKIDINMKIEKIIIIVIYIIIFIKVVFLISAIGHIILSRLNNTSNNSKILDQKLIYWKSRSEFIFIILMALLLIFIFNPRQDNKKYITKEMGILFYLFGFILIITADWSVFIKEANWFKQISNAVKL